MTTPLTAENVRPGRLSPSDYRENFSDLHPPLSDHEAAVEADRCYFCYDAPCMNACPTEIDIPLFIRQIAADNPNGAAKTILAQNIMGAMCARVCPTETLCEEACVRETAEGKPVKIGLLQRYATDHLMETVETHPFRRAASTGKKVAVVGAGPAGLSCAHRLAMKGYDVTVFEMRDKPGGLNEFGIAAYKATDGIAQAEVDWLLGIGGIEIRYGMKLGRDITVEALAAEYNAVFLGIGLAGGSTLDLPGAGLDGVADAISYISALRQTDDLATLPVGRDVVVIGGGMTAIDIAVQTRLLGAETVTLLYRRGRDRMNASRYEQDLATSKGVRIVTNARPVAFHGDGRVAQAEFARTREEAGTLVDTGETFRLAADQVFLATGQRLEDAPGALARQGAKLAAGENGRTGLARVWAGGDCTGGGEDLTVTAVAEGRDAAEDIHRVLMG